MDIINEKLLDNFRKFGVSEEFLTNPYFSENAGFSVETANNYVNEIVSSVDVNESQKTVTLKMQSGVEYTYRVSDPSTIMVEVNRPKEENRENNTEYKGINKMTVHYNNDSKTIMSTTLSAYVGRKNNGTQDVKVSGSADKMERLFDKDGLEIQYKDYKEDYTWDNTSNFVRLDLESMLPGLIHGIDIPLFGIDKNRITHNNTVKKEEIYRTQADLCKHVLFLSDKGVIEHDYTHEVVPLKLDRLHILPEACQERLGDYVTVNEYTLSTEDLIRAIEGATSFEIPEKLKPGLLKMVNEREEIIAKEREKQQSDGMVM